MPDFVWVSSGLIKAVGYDLEQEEMTVLFHSGAEYVYSDVSLPVYEALIKAQSPGAFFVKHIRGKYGVVRK